MFRACCADLGLSRAWEPKLKGDFSISSLASFPVRAEQEAFEIICCDRGTSLLFVPILLRCFAGNGAGFPGCLLLDAGPGDAWEKVLKEQGEKGKG